jgi:hypothetical protein
MAELRPAVAEHERIAAALKAMDDATKPINKPRRRRTVR